MTRAVAVRRSRLTALHARIETIARREGVYDRELMALIRALTKRVDHLERHVERLLTRAKGAA